MQHQEVPDTWLLYLNRSPTPLLVLGLTGAYSNSASYMITSKRPLFVRVPNYIEQNRHGSGRDDVTCLFHRTSFATITLDLLEPCNQILLWSLR